VTTQAHRNRIYSTQSDQEVSWFEPLPEISVRMMESAGLTAESCVLDVGGGNSRLVDYLVGHGLDCVAVLDVSGAVLDAAKERLGASSPEMVFAGAALWGLHMAATQGLLAKLVADAAPADLLGTGFGVFIW
jgi:hypothetical protein